MPGQQRDAERSVADERDAVARPTRHDDLTDAIEVEIVRAIDLAENARALPVIRAVFLMQHQLLRRRVELRQLRVGVGGEDEQEQGSVVAQGDASEHAARLAIHHVDIVVAWAVTAGFERRHHVAEALFKAFLWPKYQSSNRRMQTVGADDQIEPALAPAFELDLDGIAALFEADDFVAENDFRAVLDLLVQQLGQFAASDRHITSAGQFVEDPRAETGNGSAFCVHDAHFTHVIAGAVDAVAQAHALGNVVAEPPEVDDVTACAQGRRVLDQSWLEPGGFQPEGKGGAGDTCARDQDGFHLHTLDLARMLVDASRPLSTWLE